MSTENLPPEFEALSPSPEPVINLSLTPADCDLLLASLGLGVFNEVAPLIAKIRAQGLPQAEAFGVLNWLDAAPVDGLTPN